MVIIAVLSIQVISSGGRPDEPHRDLRGMPSRTPTRPRPITGPRVSLVVSMGTTSRVTHKARAYLSSVQHDQRLPISLSRLSMRDEASGSWYPLTRLGGRATASAIAS